MLEDRKYRNRLDRLIDQWTRYRTLVLNRLGAPDLTPAEEKQFLDLKGRVAENMTALTGWLNPSLTQEVQAHLRGIHAVLGNYPTLFSDEPLTDEDRAKFERDWHDHFLFFNRLKGMKPDLRPQDARPRAGAAGGAGSFTQADTIRKPSGGTRFVTVLLRLLFVVTLVAIFIRFIPWKYLKGGPEASGGMRGFLIAVGDRVKDTFTGVQPPSLGGVLDPVVEAYGSELTTILIAGFILVVGYFLFVRMK